MSERQRQVSGLTRKLVAEASSKKASALKIDQEAKSANLPFVTYLNEKGISTERIATAEADECTTHILDLDAIKLGSSDPTSSPSSWLFRSGRRRHDGRDISPDFPNGRRDWLVLVAIRPCLCLIPLAFFTISTPQFLACLFLLSAPWWAAFSTLLSFDFR